LKREPPDDSLINQLPPVRCSSLWYPMLAPHVNNKIIISLDPLLANLLASGNRTVNPPGKVNYLIVSVERLSRAERGRSGTIRCVTSVGPAGASMWTASPG